MTRQSLLQSQNATKENGGEGEKRLKIEEMRIMSAACELRDSMCRFNECCYFWFIEHNVEILVHDCVTILWHIARNNLHFSSSRYLCEKKKKEKKNKWENVCEERHHRCASQKACLKWRHILRLQHQYTIARIRCLFAILMDARRSWRSAHNSNCEYDAPETILIMNILIKIFGGY